MYHNSSRASGVFFGPAEPHCPDCGRDFVLEWQNEDYGHITLCMWCLTDGMTKGVVLRKSSGKRLGKDGRVDRPAKP